MKEHSGRKGKSNQLEIPKIFHDYTDIVIK